MHIWHHSKTLPPERKNGVNFGISLSIWDYIFKTNYNPHDGGENQLGFKNIEHFPTSFFSQIVFGFKKQKKKPISD